VGLLGGSIGLALRERGLARHVIGIGRNPRTLATAVSLGAVEESTTDLAVGVAEAELVIVCTPVETIADHVRKIAAAAPTALITDVGSTKEQIVAEAAAARFIGSHPLAGSEKSGVEHARADLFAGRIVIVTPTATSPEDDLAALTEFWQSLDARVVTMTPAEHDAALAHTSHLPHLIASILAAATPESLLPLVATGWLDTTRIAAGDVELWRQIFAANRDHSLRALDDFAKVLAQARAALEKTDYEALAALLAQGKRVRDAVGN
jgi:prephenate dehydrogenase